MGGGIGVFTTRHDMAAVGVVVVVAGTARRDTAVVDLVAVVVREVVVVSIDEVVDEGDGRVDKVVVGRVELVEGQVVVDEAEACKASLELSQVSEEGGRHNHIGGMVDQVVGVVAGRVVDSIDQVVEVVVEKRVEEVVDIAGGGAVSDGVGVGGG